MEHFFGGKTSRWRKVALYSRRFGLYACLKIDEKSIRDDVGSKSNRDVKKLIPDFGIATHERNRNEIIFV